MATPSSIFKHPTHPMFIVFPIGLWVFSFIGHIIHMLNGSPAWETVATYTMAGGLVGAIVAAIPGTVDLLAMPSSVAKRIAWWHAAVNVLVLIILAAAFFLRLGGMRSTVAIWIAAVGMLLLVVGGWLGGSLVYVHGVGVEFEGKEERKRRMEQSENQ